MAVCDACKINGRDGVIKYVVAEGKYLASSIFKYVIYHVVIAHLHVLWCGLTKYEHGLIAK